MVVKESGRTRAELVSLLLVLLVSVPLVLVFARALADGHTRHREVPLRLLLGNEAFERLASGEPTAEHYWGDDRIAPDFTLSDRHGRPWELKAHRGKTVILNFWSLSCPPCIEELPSFERLAQMVEDRDDIEVVTVSVDSGWQEIRSLFPDGEPEVEVLFDPERSVVQGKFGTRLFPETWFIDPEGVIRLRIDGKRDWSNPLVLDVLDSLT